MSEFNKPHGANRLAEEAPAYEETKNYSEYADVKSNACADELNSDNAKRLKKPVKKNRINDIVKAFFVATIAVVSVAAFSAFNADVEADITALSVTDTRISYTVNVDSDEAVELVVYNDFTRRNVSLLKGENEGEVTDLKPNVKYTVALVCKTFLSERTLEERSVLTDKTPSASPVTELYSVESECKCNVDGYFHFKLNFIDENNYWSDFEATLTDAFGNVSVCEFVGDVHDEQKIDVTINAALRGTTATFTVVCRTSDPSAEQERVILYSRDVKI